MGAIFSKPKSIPVPQAPAKKEPKEDLRKAATQEAEANRKRVLGETDTIRTSALGNAETAEIKKKTLLGG